jgi:hypothetical protein
MYQQRRSSGSNSHEFLAWATARVPWRDYATVTGDQETAATFLDVLNITWGRISAASSQPTTYGRRQAIAGRALATLVPGRTAPDIRSHRFAGILGRRRQHLLAVLDLNHCVEGRDFQRQPHALLGEGERQRRSGQQ